MPTTLTCQNFPLTLQEVTSLWQATIAYCTFTDEEVSVSCASSQEIQQLNKTYRGHDRATNVLTFTYPVDAAPFVTTPAEHDIVVCLEVAEQEATERNVAYKDYVALLLTHAFLHAAGMDHERSSKEQALTQKAEEEILNTAGFSRVSL